MKNKSLIILLFLFTLKIFSQSGNEGYIVEDNKNVSVELSIYNIPLKINKVNSQDQIDYSNIDGLLQSFFSANNEKWALDEYLDKNVKISRDEEHFQATKKLGNQNYIQKELIYEFNYLDHQMAYVKYSFIVEKIPFPIIGIMSMEKVKNRWYISNLLNQGAILSILSRTNPNFLIDLFSGKSSNAKYDELIKSCKNKSGIVDIVTFYKKMQKLHDENSLLYKELTDQRLIIKDIEFRNANINAKPSSSYKFNVSQPFVYDNVQLYEYKNSEKGITVNDKNFEKYSHLPESLIINNNPIDLISKLKITFQNEEYVIIKYEKDPKKLTSIIKNSDGKFLISESNNFNNITELLLMTQTSFLQKILSNQYLQSKDFISGSDGGINANSALEYIKLNKTSLSKYLDK